MFKTTVTYKDFNDKQHTEDLYFHIMTPELADLNFNAEFDDDMGVYIREAMTSGNMRKIYVLFKLLIVNSYGRRSEDGSKFTKNQEWTEEFLNSRAYEEFFVKLIEDAKFAESFWKGIMPERLLEQSAEIEAETKKKPIDMSKDELLVLIQEKLGEKKAANEVTS